MSLCHVVATVLTACGIETNCNGCEPIVTCVLWVKVATVLTACGIETGNLIVLCCLCLRLQQYLPLAVLKRSVIFAHPCLSSFNRLQQYLPLAVLKRSEDEPVSYEHRPLQQYLPLAVLKLASLMIIFSSLLCCNSTYRLRYWNESFSSRI